MHLFFNSQETRRRFPINCVMWNLIFCGFKSFFNFSSSSSFLPERGTDPDSFGLLSGPWMRVQRSDSVVYAVINRGSAASPEPNECVHIWHDPQASTEACMAQPAFCIVSVVSPQHERLIATSCQDLRPESLIDNPLC